MNKADLINAIAAATDGMSKTTSNTVLNAVFSVIQDQLAKSGSVQLLGFGSSVRRARLR